MSRIGKKPIPIPSGVQVQVQGDEVRVKGPKGDLSLKLQEGIELKIEGAEALVTRKSDARFHRARQGLFRASLNNMITGVTEGFQKTLEISGVGYRAQTQGKTLTLSLGFSHPTVFALPDGIEVKVDNQTTVTIRGADKYWVGQTAAQIRGLKPPEPYKGKGIKYAGEVIRRKEGKSSK